MVVDFSSKLNFEAKQIKFVDKVYTLKTDHKTGLLLQELYNKGDVEGLEEKILKLAFGEKQYEELMTELEDAGKDGAVNYTENINVIIFGVMSVLYNKPYEFFENAVENTEKK